MKSLGAAAELRDEPRHPHALRHTRATELLRGRTTVVDVRVLLGHASVKTTSGYLASGEDAKSTLCAPTRARSIHTRGRPRGRMSRSVAEAGDDGYGAAFEEGASPGQGRARRAPASHRRRREHR
jgi:hypothetical protein